ncbi:hypothetical protein AB0M28_15085 [Streptomyces sp. NPDC051940]|uniref:hypothetical protein n=1 Tax=Streptomyces sp. NPDC051940 TaxID=3155675 RepID=UPI003440AB1A
MLVAAAASFAVSLPLAACLGEGGVSATAVCGGVSDKAGTAVVAIAGDDRFEHGSEGDVPGAAATLNQALNGGTPVRPLKLCDIRPLEPDTSPGAPRMESIPVTAALLADLPQDPNEGLESSYYSRRYPYGLRASAGFRSGDLYFKCAREGDRSGAAMIVEMKSESLDGVAVDDSPDARMALLRELAGQLATSLGCPRTANVPTADKPYINKR